MNLATVLVRATEGAHITEIRVNCAGTPARIDFGLFGTTVEPHRGVILHPQSDLRLSQVQVELDPAGQTVGWVEERRPDGSVWARSLEEGDWIWSGV